MKIKVSGTYRERTRINLLFFWITGPWKSKPFDRSFVVPEKGVRFAIGPVTFAASPVDGQGVVASVSIFEHTVWDSLVPIPLGLKIPLHTEPIKGVILDAVVEVVL